MAVVASKNVPWCARMAGVSCSVHAATACSEIGAPSTWMRSRKLTRWGDV